MFTDENTKNIMVKFLLTLKNKGLFEKVEQSKVVDAVHTVLVNRGFSVNPEQALEVYHELITALQPIWKQAMEDDKWEQIAQAEEEDEEETIEELQEENQQLRENLLCLNDRISGCEPSLRDYLRGRNWRPPEDDKNDCEDAPKTIEQLREENQQLRLDRRSLENRISGCEPSVIDYLRG